MPCLYPMPRARARLKPMKANAPGPQGRQIHCPGVGAPLMPEQERIKDYPLFLSWPEGMCIYMLELTDLSAMIEWKSPKGKMAFGPSEARSARFVRLEREPKRIFLSTPAPPQTLLRKVYHVTKLKLSTATA